jgi:hypothetical protein
MVCGRCIRCRAFHIRYPVGSHVCARRLFVAADYLVAVWVRYAVLLAAGAIARAWELPDAWSGPIAAGVLLFAVIVIHAEPAARHARGLRDPWHGRMMLLAACAHAFGAAAVYALLPQVEPRYRLPSTGLTGLQFQAPWVTEPSLLEVGAWVGVYALAAAVCAVGIGLWSRDRWGIVAPDGHLVRIRKPAGDAPM